MIKRKIKPGSSFADILSRRVSRRDMFKGGASFLAGASLTGCTTPSLAGFENSVAKPQFKEVSRKITTDLVVPEDYQYQVLLRWGDPLFPDSPQFDPLNQTEESQLKQFGCNNDYVGFLPLLDEDRSQDKSQDKPKRKEQVTRGLLAINHEHTKIKLMYPGISKVSQLSELQTRIDIAAHGLSIVEVELEKGIWKTNLNSKFNRRITPYTEMKFTGPAAGSKRLKSNLSKDGKKTFGTYANCAGGVTPWGTVLTAEENVDEYFTGDIDALAEAENYKRLSCTGEAEKSWSKYFSRWDLNKNPNELNHAGWIVEIDPYDPDSVPTKKTALGHFKHEGCNVHINLDGRAIAYTGDDEKFEYIYRFISKNKMRFDDSVEAKKHNMSLLDEGTLSVAKFSDNGSLEWLPLVYGQSPLNNENGFNSQADISIETRRAADLVGATPMDRPEDIEVNPVNNRVYAMLTKNPDRMVDELEPCNPRAKNKGGHIIEMTAPGGDHSASQFKWDMLVLGGIPDEQFTSYHPATTKNGWIACPDNCAFDSDGHLWTTSDGADDLDIADGLWQIETDGINRGLTRRFLSVPIGAELCGPFFTPDSRYLFCAVQHPAGGSSFDNPSTRWPDFDEKLPPRSAVVVISHIEGKIIGG